MAAAIGTLFALNLGMGITTNTREGNKMKLKALIILGLTVIGISLSAKANAMGMIYFEQNISNRGLVTFQTGTPTSPIMKESGTQRSTELQDAIAEAGADLNAETRNQLTQVLATAVAGDKQTTLDVLKAAVDVLSAAEEEAGY